MEVSSEHKWYTVQVFSNQEMKIKRAIETKIAQKAMEDYFQEIFIPTEQVRTHSKSGKTSLRTKTSFPGYMFVKMLMNEKSFDLVRTTDKVTGFVGGAKPVIIKEEEVDAMRDRTNHSAMKPRPKTDFKINDSVKIISGAFQNFSGKVIDFNSDKSKAKVEVNIFGRETSLEISITELATC